jgi:hypothetical protein
MNREPIVWPKTRRIFGEGVLIVNLGLIKCLWQKSGLRRETDSVFAFAGQLSSLPSSVLIALTS